MSPLCPERSSLTVLTLSNVIDGPMVFWRGGERAQVLSFLCKDPEGFVDLTSTEVSLTNFFFVTGTTLPQTTCPTCVKPVIDVRAEGHSTGRGSIVSSDATCVDRRHLRWKGGTTQGLCSIVSVTNGSLGSKLGSDRYRSGSTP